MKTFRIVGALAALTLGVGLTMVAPQAALAATPPPHPTCSGYGCDGKDPATYCPDGTTVSSRFINDESGQAVGTIELRYSRNCRTTWGRIGIYRTLYEAGAVTFAIGQVIRNVYPYPSQRCRSLAWSDVTRMYTCYTTMLNDANLTSFANGQVGLTYNASTAYAETSLY